MASPVLASSESRFLLAFRIAVVILLSSIDFSGIHSTTNAILLSQPVHLSTYMDGFAESDEKVGRAGRLTMVMNVHEHFQGAHLQAATTRNIHVHVRSGICLVWRGSRQSNCGTFALKVAPRKARAKPHMKDGPYLPRSTFATEEAVDCLQIFERSLEGRRRLNSLNGVFSGPISKPYVGETRSRQSSGLDIPFPFHVVETSVARYHPREGAGEAPSVIQAHIARTGRAA